MSISQSTCCVCKQFCCCLLSPDDGRPISGSSRISVCFCVLSERMSVCLEKWKIAWLKVWLVASKWAEMAWNAHYASHCRTFRWKLLFYVSSVSLFALSHPKCFSLITVIVYFDFAFFFQTLSECHSIGSSFLLVFTASFPRYTGPISSWSSVNSHLSTVQHTVASLLQCCLFRSLSNCSKIVSQFTKWKCISDIKTSFTLRRLFSSLRAIALRC